MNKKAINELLMTYKNFNIMIEELNKKPSLRKKLVTSTEILKEGIKTLQTTKEMTPELFERFTTEAQHLDSLYDIIECYPDEFGIPSSFKPIALPYIQYILESKGINELEMEELNIKSCNHYYRAFNWSL